jgi:hypothetical protein
MSALQRIVGVLQPDLQDWPPALGGSAGAQAVGHRALPATPEH